jgi:hypothetical protein
LRRDITGKRNGFDSSATRRRAPWLRSEAHGAAGRESQAASARKGRSAKRSATTSAASSTASGASTSSRSTCAAPCAAFARILYVYYGGVFRMETGLQHGSDPEEAFSPAAFVEGGTDNLPQEQMASAATPSTPTRREWCGSWPTRGQTTCSPPWRTPQHRGRSAPPPAVPRAPCHSQRRPAHPTHSKTPDGRPEGVGCHDRTVVGLPT